ncbi:MAG: T9SS type A sorting domain-containing protein [Bacteroidetes bacterium]|nr:T9SS type A sorting domain-containing protein [Bacteroidota bacterium]
MKKIILATLLLLPLIANAQATFAPPGSEWYHSQQYGVFHCYYAGDTVINNIASRIIVRKALTRDPYYSQGLHVDDQSTIYVYNNTDTVFIYNRYFHRFTPLYVFNVNDGDTIRLPIIPIDYGQLTLAYPDSTFRIVVDSVRNKLYDTAMLKTVYVHAIGNPDSAYVLDYGVGYAATIGGLGTGLIPMGTPAAIPLTESLQPATGIKCYNDPTLSIKLVAGICGIPPVGIPTIASVKEVELTPNPVSGILTISCPQPITSLHIYDAMGREVYKGASADKKMHIDLTALPAGIYFAHINGTEVRRFIKE